MAVDRKQQMKEITERLEQGVKDIFTSEMYTTYLRTMAKFHNYSFNNTLLIAMQRPDATLVAGFNAWKNKFNRYVKKGEKGIQIIAPAPIEEVEEREKIDKDTGLAVLNENGEPEMERVEYVVPRFLQVLQIVFGKVVLVSSLAVDWPFGVGLRLYIGFAQAVDYDVGMDVACSIIAICMGADQSLMPRKISFCVFQPDGLCTFSC